MIGRLARLVGIGALCLAMCGCETVVRGPKPPSFPKQHQTIAFHTARMERIGDVLETDVQQIDQTRTAFFRIPRQRYRTPFPLSLFKQTAMACLNQPLGTEKANTSVFAAPPGELRDLKIRFGVKITCSPPSLHELLRHTAEHTPESAPLVVAQLERVDQVRVLRGKLLQRIALMPRLLRRDRAALANMRAQWRQQRARIQKKRKEFNKKNLIIATQRLEAYRLELERYEREIQDVERLIATLTPLVQTSIEQFYFDLAALYARR